MEHIEGKLVVEENGYGQKVLIRVKGDDVNIATTLATVLELDNNIEQDEANAEHLVKCWNAFEEGGSVDKLLKACEKARDWADDSAWGGRERIVVMLEAAIAAAAQEQSKEKKQ